MVPPQITGAAHLMTLPAAGARPYGSFLILSAGPAAERSAKHQMVGQPYGPRRFGAADVARPEPIWRLAIWFSWGVQAAGIDCLCGSRSWNHMVFTTYGTICYKSRILGVFAAKTIWWEDPMVPYGTIWCQNHMVPLPVPNGTIWCFCHMVFAQKTLKTRSLPYGPPDK